MDGGGDADAIQFYLSNQLEEKVLPARDDGKKLALWPSFNLKGGMEVTPSGGLSNNKRAIWLFCVLLSGSGSGRSR